MWVGSEEHRYSVQENYRRFTSYSPVGLSQSFNNFQGIQKFMGTFYSQKVLPAKAIITLKRGKKDRKTINTIICNADLSKNSGRGFFKWPGQIIWGLISSVIWN